MNFEELHEHIPYIIDGEEKSIVLEPYPNIRVALPGRHAQQTTPKGGDFLVMVTDGAVGWKDHPFSHVDIFQDIELKYRSWAPIDILMSHYYSVIHHNIDIIASRWHKPVGVTPHIFLQAVQSLAVAEHRRYHQHESRLGGKYLPFRYAAGIAEGLWTAADAATKQKLGRPGVEWLEKDHGVPDITLKLMYDVGLTS